MQQYESDQASVLSADPAGNVPAGPGGPGRDGLVAEGLTKTFGPTTALRQVSVHFGRGRVHGLIGENGSGKSTFVKVLAGIHRADLGRVTLDGATVAASDGTAPGRVRVGTVYQDGSLIEELTVGQNLDLIVEPAAREKATVAAAGAADGEAGPAGGGAGAAGDAGSWRRRLLDRFGLAGIDLASRVVDLPANEQRLVEIAAVLARRPDVLLFDESTSVLDERGVAQVLAAMREAAAQGACVIFVTHRLHEVLAVASDVTVLRDGAVVAAGLPTVGASTDALVRYMAGREVAAFQRRDVSHAGAATALTASQVRAERCGPVDLTVRSGEIVGIAGAAGNGQAELIRALAGEGQRGGRVEISGRSLSRPERAVQLGAVFVSADRRQQSLSSLLSVRENYTIARPASTGRWWSWLRRGPETRAANALADRYDLARGSIEQPVSSLSGGNQQKVAIGRAVARRPDVLLVEEPTAGVDVRSRFSIYRSLTEVAQQGTAVVFTSTDAGELRLLADRVIVLARGRRVAELQGEDVTEEAIVHAFSTATENESAAEAGSQAIPRGRRLLNQVTWTPATFALLVVLLIALGGYASARASSFATMGNVGSILQLCLPLALVAMAEMPVLLAGEIDASLGSMMGLIVVMLSFLPHLSVPVAFLLAIAAGGVCGLVNALLVVGIRINSVIATIATLGIFLGAGEILRPTPGGVISLHLSSAVQSQVGQIPVLFIVAVVLAILIDLGINLTRTGLKTRAVGYSAPRSAQLGVRFPLFRAAMYVLAGLIAGLGGAVLAAQTATGDPSVGSGYTLLSLAVPVIGGALLSGGRGSAIGCVLGAMFIAELEDFIPFINIPNGGYLITIGALTVLALIVGSRHDLAPRAALARLTSIGRARPGRK
ncbi:MAG: ATP-binding cassette domain-containing protein [Actinobacteria bacterium]|nr:ATP-binding cassette domain-containing protein [Actinomycetota bacterium]